MRNPHGTPIWYELITPDPDAAKAFYDDVVGWTIEATPAGQMDYRMIDTGNGLVGGVMRLQPAVADGGAKPGWMFYIGVNDVDASVEQAEAAGATVGMPATTLDGIGRMAMLVDPQGAPFYVMRGASDDRSTAFRTAGDATPGHAVWNELSAPDPDAAIRFYADLAGWRQEGAMPMGELGDYRFLYAGADPIGAAMRVAPAGRPGWLFYFMVSDIDAAAARVGAGGGTVTQGPTEIPGGDFSLTGVDPQGVAFGLVGARKES